MANYLLAANNAISTLAGAITNTATTANLQSGTGALFSNPGSNQYFVATLIDAATGLLREIVWVTARSTDAVTIVRAQEGTEALNWNAGDLFQNLWTAGSMASLSQPGQYSVQDTGVANSMVITLTATPTSWGQLIGLPILVQVGSGNTNTSTAVVINANGLGNKTILRSNFAPPSVGSIIGGSWIELVYDGTEVQCISGLQETQTLAANTTFYVSNSGSDSNNGLTSGTAWATLTHAYSAIQSQYDLGGYTAMISIADGTYAPLLATGAMRGQKSPASVIFQGDTTTPANVIVSATNSSAIAAVDGAQLWVRGMALSATGSSSGQGCGIYAGAGGSVAFDQCNFGNCTVAHLSSNNPSAQFGFAIAGDMTYSITAAAPVHAASAASVSSLSGATVAISGTPAFSTAFAVATLQGILDAANMTFTGTGATGSRYAASLNGIIYTNGAQSSPTENYLPGNAAGTTASGGQVA